MTRRLAMAGILLAALLSTACQNMPGPFAPPVQRQPLGDFRPYRMSAIVDMADPGIEKSFVQDITPIGTESWRWTGQRPTLRVRMRSGENVHYTIDFAIAEATLRVTGPVTVSFLVDGRVLHHARYTRTGGQHFEKAVPPGWVTANQDVMVGAEVDKLWHPPQGGPDLGIILVRMGLTQ